MEDHQNVGVEKVPITREDLVLLNVYLLLNILDLYPDSYWGTILTMLLFRCSVVSDSLWPDGLQSTRPPCPSPSLEVCPSSRSLHWWCCPAISSSDALFSFCPQSSPASGTFSMNHLFTSDDQNTGASASVLPVNIQGWSPLRLTGLILLSKGLSRVFSWLSRVEGINSLVLSFLYGPTLTSVQHYRTNHSFDYMDICCQGDVSVS